jgi:molybdopterin-guanine dinucleotide biosynthesis protein A
MVKKNGKNESLIKFVAPVDLKDSLQKLANERNITISSLLRLIASDYVKRHSQT